MRRGYGRVVARATRAERRAIIEKCHPGSCYECQFFRGIDDQKDVKCAHAGNAWHKDQAEHSRHAYVGEKWLEEGKYQKQLAEQGYISYDVFFVHPVNGCRFWQRKETPGHD